MKKFIFVVFVFIFGLFIFFSNPSEVKAARTRGYFKSNGTYVQPYYRSNSNSFKWDNYSSRGNINPWTGKRGYKSWW